MEKKRRPIDDFSRILAIIICILPVGTFCALAIMSLLIHSAGGVPPDQKDTFALFQPIVLMIIGGAVGFAFGSTLQKQAFEKMQLSENIEKTGKSDDL